MLSSPSYPIQTLEGLLHRMTDHIRRSIELPEILTSTVNEMQLFLKTDRVKVYRFQEDGSGKVVAEAIADKRLPSLLGHYFPAEDIPDRAREMFLKARQRTIVNVKRQEIGISPLICHKTQAPLSNDLWFRPVDPCHVEYLMAMGVQASLVVPILHQDHLWGLLVAHHSTPRWFSPKELEMVQLIADQVAVAIAHADILTESRLRTQHEATINQVVSLLHAPSRDASKVALGKAVAALKSTSGRLHVSAKDSSSILQLTHGHQPNVPHSKGDTPQSRMVPPVLEQLSDWQTWLNMEVPVHPQGRLWAITDIQQAQLPWTIAFALSRSNLRGMMVVELRHRNHSLGYLSFFRRAIDVENVWAGRLNAADPRQNRPRQSFETWRELKRNQAHAWTSEDIRLAQALADQFASVLYQTQLYEEVQALNTDLEKRVLQRTTELQRANANLRLEIMERERTLKALQQARDSLERLSYQNELILKSAGEGICGLDSRGKVVFVNPAAAEILGYTAKQMVGQFMPQLIRHSKPDGTLHRWEESPIFNTLRRGKTHHVSGDLFERRDGFSFPAEYVSTPIQERDKILGAVVTFKDITERQIIERMKDEFISVVSHELRTPLTSIRTALGLLAQGDLNVQAEKRQRMVEIAFSNTNRLVRLVNDILDAERIKLGKVTLNKQICNLTDLMAQAADEMRAIAEKNQVHLAIQSLSIELWADPDRLIQTLTNLLSNAIKFSPPGSTVEMIVHQIQSDQVSVPTEALPSQDPGAFSRMEAPSEMLLVQVKDQGQGIPEDKLEVIFNQFEQLNVSDTEHQGGTGLGLAICRSIIQQHNGRIWAENNADGGSTFFFTLPL
ncbi:GAF domain-containing protein [Oscillatoria sp. CS-180]|uniref:ATP-binding protein n=1 Tax=Oscillatoria sp. CS-180 TaxID=3021720 RepID=UPI00232AA3EA|nr:ATP-binding protein [Oscillatoria sp. CS-180]MDB9526382.1 GAF domain-containing protein [Oscillatoria sp. CS-180]